MNQELFTSLEPFLKGVGIGGVTLLLALAYAVWRTGSLHLVRRRLWALFYGKEGVLDKDIQSFVADRSSLMAFRFNAGVHARTLGHAKRMVKWANDNDEDIHAITAAGPHFDHVKLEIREPLPNAKKKMGRFLIFTSLAFGLFMMVASPLTTRAYYAVKSTGLWFSASQTDVQEAGPSFLAARWPVIVLPTDTQPLTAAMCKENKFPANTFGASQSVVLCQFLQDSGKEQRLSNDLKTQRLALAALAGLVVVGLGVAALGLARLQAAVLMKDRLTERKKQSSVKPD